MDARAWRLPFVVWVEVALFNLAETFSGCYLFGCYHTVKLLGENERTTLDFEIERFIDTWERYEIGRVV